jgi:hypothetical protein
MSEIKSDKKGFLLYLIIYLCRGNFISRFFDNRELNPAKLAKKNQLLLHVS